MKIVAAYLTGLMLVMATYILGAMILGVVGFYVGGIGLVILSLLAIVDAFKSTTHLNATLFALSCSVMLVSIGAAAAYSMSYASTNPVIDMSSATSTAEMGWSGGLRWWGDWALANLESPLDVVWFVVTIAWLIGGAIWAFKSYGELTEENAVSPDNFFHASVIAAWGLTGGSLVGWLLGGLTWVGYDFIHG